MSRKEHHVVHNSSKGGWDVMRRGAQRSSVHASTKAEAIKMGRIMSQRARSELVVHGTDGRIQYKDSHGYNPCPPCDNK